MKILQVLSETVVDILNAKDDITMDSIFVVDNVPAFKAKEGYSGILKYDSDKGVYWEYVQNPPSEEQEISSEELQSMIEEVL